MTKSSQADAVFFPLVGSEETLAHAAYLAALADPTPEGLLMADVSRQKMGEVYLPEAYELARGGSVQSLCGINFRGQMIRMGTLNAVEGWLRKIGGKTHKQLRSLVREVLSRGGIVSVVAKQTRVLGVVCLHPASG